MFEVRRVAMVCVLGASLLAANGCKQEEPPAPPKPSTAPLAEAAPKATAQPQLPPGHPPINGQSSAGPIPPNAKMPDDHPPIDGVTAGAQSQDKGLPAGHPPMGGAMGGSSNSGGMPAMRSALASGNEKLLDEAPTQFAGITLTPPADWQPFDPGNGPMSPVAAFVLPKAEGDETNASARLTYFPGMRNMPQMVDLNLNRWYGQVQQPDGKPTSEIAKKSVFEANGAKITLVDMPGIIDGTPDQRMIAAIIEHPKGPHFLKVAGPTATVERWHEAVVNYLKSATVIE